MASAEQQRESLNIQLLVDSSHALIHTAGPDGCIDYFNRAGLDYLGATLDDVSGWKWTAFGRADYYREGCVSRRIGERPNNGLLIGLRGFS